MIKIRYIGNERRTFSRLRNRWWKKQTWFYFVFDIFLKDVNQLVVPLKIFWISVASLYIVWNSWIEKKSFFFKLSLIWTGNALWKQVFSPCTISIYNAFVFESTFARRNLLGNGFGKDIAVHSEMILFGIQFKLYKSFIYNLMTFLCFPCF